MEVYISPHRFLEGRESGLQGGGMFLTSQSGGMKKSVEGGLLKEHPYNFSTCQLSIVRYVWDKHVSQGGSVIAP